MLHGGEGCKGKLLDLQLAAPWKSLFLSLPGHQAWMDGGIAGWRTWAFPSFFWF